MSGLYASIAVTITLMIGFTAIWLVALKIKKWAIVDPFWSFSVGFNALLYAILSANLETTRQWLICAVCVVYSLRLGGHLMSRFLSHEEDDPRYVEFAREWGDKAKPRMLLFFQFQALGSAALSIPIFVSISASDSGYAFIDYIGISIAVAALIGEAIADRQLKHFKKSNHSSSAICKEGLWRYSRHPNYFFQWLFWVAFIPLGIGSPWWWLTFISPVLMYHFLNNVTGIPPTEKRSLESKGDAYRKYQEETSAFFPLPTRTNQT